MSVNKPHALKFDEYPKIHSLFKRNEKGVFETPPEGGDYYSIPEFACVYEWVLSEKIDGTNIRIGYQAALGEYESKIIIGGRTKNAQLPMQLVTFLADKFSLSKMKEVFEDRNVVLYGEGYGSSIKDKNKKARDREGFVLFDAVIDGKWLLSKSLDSIATQLNVERPTNFGHFDLVNKNYNEIRDWIINLAHDEKFKDVEGFVARPALGWGIDTPLFSSTGERLIWKLKFRDRWS